MILTGGGDMTHSIGADQNKVDEIRHDIGQAVMMRLNSQHLSDIDHQHLAEDTGHDSAVIRRIFPNLSVAVDQGLQDIDDGITARLADDFAEDTAANIRDRILEGLIVRHETYVPFKQAMKHLNKAATMNPKFGIMMVERLSLALHALLILSGVDTSGLKGLLRVKGLVGVALSVQRDWFADDTADLSVTIRMLDKRLSEAESLARTLTLVTDEDHDD
jgi:hypothetical protein